MQRSMILAVAAIAIAGSTTMAADPSAQSK